MSALEIVAVVVSVLGIWLTTQRKLSSWPITILSCFLYAAVFWREKLYSDMLLQFVYVAFAVYGWWHWWRGVREEGDVRVERLSAQGWVAGILAGAVGGVLLGLVMARYTNAALPYMDSSLTSLSLVAQFWATRKYIANWWLWIVVDVFYTGMFVFKHLYLTAGLYAFLVLLAVVGLRAWQKARNEQSQRNPVVSAAPVPL